MRDRDTMLERLPHRAPFVFVTRVVELAPGEHGRGEWAVTGDEAFFRGHFPGEPVVPGVLIGEALAQLAGLVGLHLGGEGGVERAGGRGGRLVHMDVRFDRPVAPPAVIELSVKVERMLGALKQFAVSAEVEGQRVARGMLTLAEVEGGGA